MSVKTISQDVAWFHDGHVGLSSKCIWFVMNGTDPLTLAAKGGGEHPLDPDDFSRCYLLLQRNPDWRARIGEMAAVSRAWAALAAHWDELERLFLAIWGGHYDASMYQRFLAYDKAAARAMYDRMAELRHGAGAL